MLENEIEVPSCPNTATKPGAPFAFNPLAPFKYDTKACEPCCDCWGTTKESCCAAAAPFAGMVMLNCVELFTESRLTPGTVIAVDE